MIDETVVAVRLVQMTAVPIEVVEVVETAISAVYGGRRPNGINSALTASDIVTEICKGNLSGVASPIVFDDARKDIDSAFIDCICIGYVCGLHRTGLLMYLQYIR